jgi:PAS domain S-box-containing protein
MSGAGIRGWTFMAFSRLARSNATGDEGLSVLRKSYRAELSSRTLRIGRIASLLVVLGLPLFMLQDILVLKLDILHWRLMGYVPFVVFAVLAFTALSRHKWLVLPCYSAALLGFMGMMSGIGASVLSNPGTSEYIKYLTLDALVVSMIVVYFFASGARRYLGLILYIPMGASWIYLLIVSPLPLQRLSALSNPASVALALVVMAIFQERLSFDEFRMRRLAEKQDLIIGEKSAELESLNDELTATLKRLEIDLEEKRQVEERMRQDQRILQGFLDAITDPAFVVNRGFTVVFANQAFASGLHVDLASIIGKNLTALIPDEFSKYHGETLEAVNRSRKPVQVELENNERVFENTVYPVFDSFDEIAYLGVLTKDITKRKVNEQALEDIAARDSLTGLFNRRFMMEALGKAVANAKRGQGSVLLYIDLDDFKIVNDRKGHEAGDDVLR